MTNPDLLDAIRANPDEDVPRLLYADWLDEFGTTDLHRATVEFVRLSCDMRAGGRRKYHPMPRAVYPWLAENWRRLVPSLASVHDGPFHFPGHMSGRYLKAGIRLDYDYGRKLPLSLELEFHRGFVVRVAYCSFTLARFVREPLKADQPLAEWPPRIVRAAC